MYVADFTSRKVNQQFNIHRSILKINDHVKLKLQRSSLNNWNKDSEGKWKKNRQEKNHNISNKRILIIFRIILLLIHNLFHFAERERVTTAESVKRFFSRLFKDVLTVYPRICITLSTHTFACVWQKKKIGNNTKQKAKARENKISIMSL